MFDTIDRRRGPHLNGRLVFGLLVILVGALLLLDNMGFLYAGDYLRWWPLIIVAFGVSKLVGTGGTRSLVPGTVITIIGTWLLLRSIDVVDAGFWDLWPLLLILAGIGMVSGSWRRTWRPRVFIERDGPRIAGGPHGTGFTAAATDAAAGAASGAAQGAGQGAGTATADEDTGVLEQPRIHAFALLSGSNTKVVSQRFEGGDVTAIIGGHTIDLSAAKLAGGRAVIDVVIWWGGVELRIPPNWTVSTETVNVLGGVDDKSIPPTGTPAGVLVLRGPVIMGGMEIKTRTA